MLTGWNRELVASKVLMMALTISAASPLSSKFLHIFLSCQLLVVVFIFPFAFLKEATIFFKIVKKKIEQIKGGRNYASKGKCNL